MKIQSKLFLLLTGFSITLLIAFVLLAQWSIDKGIVEYANAQEAQALEPLIDDLRSLYLEQNSWQSLQDNPRQFKRLLEQRLRDVTALSPPEPQRLPPPHERRPGPPSDIRPHKPTATSDAEHRPPPRGPGRGGPPEHRRSPGASYMVLDANKTYVAGLFRQELEYGHHPITDGETILGYLAISKRHVLTQGYDLDFIDQQKSVLFFSAAVIALVVLLLSFPMARHLVAPINALTRNIHALTQGNYQSHDYPARADEFGQLQQDQNQLAKTLEQNEQARKRWLANTSHELRTPIAVLRGELEAILDGIRSNSRENIASLLQEVGHLQTLIDDLQQLNKAELGGITLYKTRSDLNALVSQKFETLKGFVHGQQMQLELTEANRPVYAMIDSTRLNQVIENIVQNSVKYAGQGHRILISLAAEKDTCTLTIEDDGAGVSDAALPLLFEYLYREESSRNRKLGGSGLGLAICKHIIEGHEGSVCAKHASPSGLAIVITLPISNKES